MIYWKETKKTTSKMKVIRSIGLFMLFSYSFIRNDTISGGARP